MSRKERKRRKKEEKRIIKTGGFVDEIYEEDFEPEDEEKPVTVQTATSEAHELLKKEIAAPTAEEMPIETTAPVGTPETAGEAKPEAVPEPERLEEEAPQPIEIKKRAIPSWSAAQLADKAKRDGDAPDIVRDEITQVTLFDYSDIIAEEMGAEE